MVETNDEWITSRSGIKERRVAASETTRSLAVDAAKAALTSANLSPTDIDLVIVATVTPDMTFPSTACFVQAELGVTGGAAAFDLSAACSGFIYALDMAYRQIETGAAKNALVIGVDLFSRITDWTDRSTCVLFGDGAGAVVVSATEGASGILSSKLHSDGRYWETLYAPGGIAPSRFEERTEEKPYVKMNGAETFKVAVRTIIKASKEALESAGVTTEEVSLMIPHQANIRIINAAAAKLGLSDDQVFINIEKYGNTSAGSIPLALDEAARGGRLKEGDLLLLVAFGGGLTWGTTVIRW